MKTVRVGAANAMRADWGLLCTDRATREVPKGRFSKPTESLDPF